MNPGTFNSYKTQLQVFQHPFSEVSVAALITFKQSDHLLSKICSDTLCKAADAPQGN